MWHHTVYAGEYITFLLCTADGNKANATDYLNNLCRIIQSDEPLETIAEWVYRPLTVYVSLLEDPDAEPTGINIDDINELEALPDEWMPLYLAIVLQHADAVTMLLTFHQRHAYYVLEKAVLRTDMKENFFLSTRMEENLEFATNSSEAVLKKTSDDSRGAKIISSAEYGLGGAIVFLCSEENYNNAGEVAEENTSNSVDMLVTSALKPLLKSLVCEMKCAGNNYGQGQFGFGFVTRVVQAYCRNETNYCAKSSLGLVVDYDVFYDVCHGNINILSDIFDLFLGLLLPVVFVRCMHIAGDNTSVELTSKTAPHEMYCNDCDTSHDNNDAAGIQFFLSFVAQEHQRLAFLATWVAYREKMSILWQGLPHGETQKKHYDGDKALYKFRTVLRRYKKIICETPSNPLWGGHLFVLSKLLSPDCSLEEFLEVIKGDYFLCPFGVPAVFIAALVAGTAVAALINKPHYVKLVCKKMELILADPHGAVSLLRNYLMSSPATHAECFETLWLAQTPHSRMMKFETRGEMLYFALVEVVLLRAEEVWKTSAGSFFADRGEGEDALFSLQEWLKMCWGIFASLAGQSFCENSEPPVPLPLADGDDVTDDVCAAGSYERGVMRRLCTAMQLRTKQGSQPLPSLDTTIFTAEWEEASRTTKGICGDGDYDVGDGSSETDVVAAFGAAQALFGTMASRTSDDVKLKFYGLYKQATVGDINISKPWIMDSVGRAKWEAWNKLKGMSTVEAMRKYVLELRLLQASLGRGASTL